MLYRLSYASNTEGLHLLRRKSPYGSLPMTGTSLKVTITPNWVQQSAAPVTGLWRQCGKFWAGRWRPGTLARRGAMILVSCAFQT